MGWFVSFLFFVLVFWPGQVFAEKRAARPALFYGSTAFVTDLGQLDLQSIKDKTLTIKNKSSVDAQLIPPYLTGALQYKGRRFPGKGGTCRSVLKKKKSCKVVLRFNAIQPGRQMFEYKMRYRAVGDQLGERLLLSRWISAQVAEPGKLAIEGNVPKGQLVQNTVEFSLTVKNGGQSKAGRIRVHQMQPPYQVVSQNCRKILTKGKSCRVKVKFLPQKAGDHKQPLHFTFYDGVMERQFSHPLDLKGYGPAQIVVDEKAVAQVERVLGSEPLALEIPIKNTGEWKATRVRWNKLVPGFRGKKSDCASLEPGKECVLKVDYHPKKKFRGLQPLAISYSDGLAQKSVTHTLDLFARGPGVLTFAENKKRWRFVKQPGVENFDVTVTNTGETPITGISWKDPGAPLLISGQCEKTLNPGKSCLLKGAMSREKVGRVKRTFAIAYHDGAALRKVKQLFDIQVSEPARLVASAKRFDYGEVLRGTSVEKRWTLENKGASPAQLKIAPQVAEGFLAVPGDKSGCQATLAPGKRCELKFRFTPQVVKTWSQNLQLAYGDGVQDQILPLQLDAISFDPAVLVAKEGPAHILKTPLLGQNREAVITIANNGLLEARRMKSQLSRSGFRFRGGKYPGTGGDCGKSLAIGAECRIVLAKRFKKLGPFNSQAAIHYFDGVARKALTVTHEGQVLKPAKLVAKKRAFTFKSLVLGTYEKPVFELKNEGEVPAKTVGWTPPQTLGVNWKAAEGGCGKEIVPGHSCFLEANITPTGRGPLKDALELTYHTGLVEKKVGLSVSAQVVNPAEISLEPKSRPDFGKVLVGNSKSQKIWVKNTGEYPAVLHSGRGLSESGVYRQGAKKEGTVCGERLAPGKRCFLPIEFHPNSVGMSGDQFGFEYESGAGLRPFQVKLSGDGVDPGRLQLKSLAQFQNIAYGAKARAKFSLENVGQAEALRISVSVQSGEGLVVKNKKAACLKKLEGKTLCEVDLEWSPKEGAPLPAAARLSYFDGVQKKELIAPIQAVAITPAKLFTRWDGKIQDVTLGNTQAHVLEIHNQGQHGAEAIQIAELPKPFQWGARKSCPDVTTGGSCLLDIVSTPVRAGDFKGQVKISYLDGAKRRTFKQSIALTTHKPANLVVDRRLDFGRVTVGTEFGTQLVVKNTGGVVAKNLLTQLTPSGFLFAGGSYPGTQGTCAQTLNAGESCLLDLNYSPQIKGTAKTDLLLSYQDGVRSQTVSTSLVATALSPGLIELTKRVDFGAIPLGKEVTKKISVTNQGESPLTGLQFSAIQPPLSLQIDETCLEKLSPKKSCRGTVTFVPSLVDGGEISLQLSGHDGARPVQQALAIASRGVRPGRLVFTEEQSLQYGDIVLGNNNKKALIVRNDGDVPVTKVRFPKKLGPFHVQSQCQENLAPNMECRAELTFTPKTSDLVNQAWSLDYHDGVGAQKLAADLTGRGRTPAKLIWEEKPETMQLIRGEKREVVYRLSNRGETPAQRVQVSPVLAPFSLDSECDSELLPGASCQLKLELESERPGEIATTLKLAYDSGLNNETLSEAVRPKVVEPAQLAFTLPKFETPFWGKTTSGELVVKNQGQVAATQVQLESGEDAFVLQGSCSEIAAGKECRIPVLFQPSDPGNQKARVTASYQNGVDEKETRSEMTARAFGPAKIANLKVLVPEVSVGAEQTKSFTIENIGESPASAISGESRDGVFEIVPGCEDLLPGKRCQFRAIFRPTESGEESESFDWSFQDGREKEDFEIEVRSKAFERALASEPPPAPKAP